MAIAQQTATRHPSSRPRPRPLVLAPERRTGRVLAKIAALLAVTVVAAALAAATIALALVLMLATLGG